MLVISELKLTDCTFDNDNVFIGTRNEHDDKLCMKFWNKLVKPLKHGAQKKYDAIAGDGYTY